MNVIYLCIFLLRGFSVPLSAIPRPVQAKRSLKRQAKFRKIKDAGDLLSSGDIISNLIVHSEVECSLRCLQKPTCVGYNAISTSSTYAVDCQLSNKTQDGNGHGHGKWAFFEEIETLSIVKDDGTITNATAHDNINEKPSCPVHFVDSQILRGRNNSILQLTQWLNTITSYSSWSLCFRATRDGWSSHTFHSKCDGKGTTVTIIQVGSYIFGGYADIDWGDFTGYRKSQNAFAFSLANRDNVPPFKSDLKSTPSAIYTATNYGPTFGGGHDIFIANNAGFSTTSYTNFGHTYTLPNGYIYIS